MAGAGWEFERRRALGQACASVVLLLMTGVTWAYLLAVSLHGLQARTPLPALAALWIVMTAAMMLPAATPTILLHLKIGQQRRERGGGGLATAAFVLGYFAVWALFGVGLSAAQWVLEQRALLSPDLEAGNVALSSALLLAAGAYQLTPLKRACLGRCRAPLEFVREHWRDGVAGGLVTGVHHGLYCLGSCGVLMLLLFVGGVTNLFWPAGLAALVLLEKSAPAGPSLAQLAGLGLMISAALLLGLEVAELAVTAA